MHPTFQYGLWAVQEWAWNIYPSTDISSMAVVGILFTTVASVWWGTRNDFVEKAAASEKPKTTVK
jgi:alpha-1,3-mannosyltransferase